MTVSVTLIIELHLEDSDSASILIQEWLARVNDVINVCAFVCIVEAAAGTRAILLIYLFE